jgi:hypothetical protein
MAKQIIAVGSAANDGSGDILRNAFIKVNENFTELYSFDAGLNVPNTLTDLSISDGTLGQLLQANGNGTFEFVDAPAGSQPRSNTDIINVITGANLDMGGNKVLFANVYDQLSDLPSASTYHGMFAHVHATGKGYFAHAGAWVELANMSDVSGGGSSLQTRATKSATASSLANDASASLTIDGFKGYALYSIQTSHAAWVRLYISTTARTNDASRTINTDPTPDAGVVAEVITTAAETVNFGPAVLGYCDTGTSIYATVTNKSGGTQNVAVTLTVLQLES